MLSKLGLTACAALLASTAAFAQTAPSTPTDNPPPRTQEAVPPATSVPPMKQDPSSPLGPRVDMTSPAGTFVTAQTEAQWLASKMIGKSVVGAGNETIGDINDVLVDRTGRLEAAVIGVGGFLGIGEKQVAVPFAALEMTRSHEGDKITLRVTKADLEKAPAFKPLQARAARSATPETTGSTAPLDPAAPSAKPAPAPAVPPKP